MPPEDVPSQASTQNPPDKRAQPTVTSGKKSPTSQKPLTPEQKKAILAKRAKEKASAAPSAQDKTLAVTLRDEFYRDRALQMFIITGITIFIFCTYLFIIIYRFTHRPLPIYFEAQRLDTPMLEMPGKTTTNFRLFKPTPLTDPFLTTPGLFIWINQALSDVFSFNFQNSEAHIQAVKSYFTEDGWKEFSKSLDESKLISQVQRGRYIVNARTVSPPLLNRQGIYKGRFEWHVNIEMYIRYRSSLTDNRQLWKVNVIAVRTPVTEEHDRGVAIDYFKVESVRASI